MKVPWFAARIRRKRYILHTKEVGKKADNLILNVNLATKTNAGADY